MASWGVELWDRFDKIIAFNRKETSELEGTYAKFFKERGELEKEYSRGLKRLVDKYLPKEKDKSKKKDKNEDDESSQTTSFRLFLTETHYQANQHEYLADIFTKDICNSIQSKVKDLKSSASNYIKDEKKYKDQKDVSDRQLERAKTKYQRSYFDWEHANMEARKAAESPDVARNHIQKTQKTAKSRENYCEQMKGEYAKELIKANEMQKLYYYQYLPGVFDNFQALEISRGNFVKDTLKYGIAETQKIVPIIVKCLEEMERVVDEINPTQDTQIVIQRYKTGNVPPDDELFEELRPGAAAIIKKPKLQAPQENLYPIKRELEKKIEALEEEIIKGQRKIEGLRRLHQISQTPEFGDKKNKGNIQGELEKATLMVQNMESDLHTLKSDLNAIERKLELIKNRTLNTHSEIGGASPLPPSSDYGTNSNSSNNSERDTDSHNSVESDFHTSREDDIPPLHHREDDFPPPRDDDFPPPPPTLFGIARAMYDFEVQEDTNISMTQGEQFQVTEEDLDGWTKVLRLDHSEEGYVPTSFLEFLH